SILRITRSHVYFFFQAEDGIRDRNVTGVQTCALPILEQSLKNLAFLQKTVSYVNGFQKREFQKIIITLLLDASFQKITMRQCFVSLSSQIQKKILCWLLMLNKMPFTKN